ncbi:MULTISPECIES: electron transport complex subunit RsxG [unclassified Oceanobacter]|uniref:electron transport complex subunit RsxG n=1 Tax=unclassified Oceanobacter TaxID=2620260 RepID=UPI002734FEB1|nr:MULTISPECIES: electron transport complex subunit RsxG [unclassified Oceanobacter]MDP2608320.1 electron transport complex subunit RsxG [Oceanobacter sp. 1_MG-2023]MDP2612205.1 electron transport complex subunit RsxG [Oceanobacter sp. 2_MG-2023]
MEQPLDQTTQSTPTAAFRDQPLYQALLLGGACAIVSLLLVVGNLGTHQTIADHLTADKLAMLAQVLPQSYYDNDPLNDTEQLSSPVLSGPATLMLARKDGDITALALQISIAGWGGIIDMIMATTPDGELLGVRIISHKETPGLADKIERPKSDWITGFDGASLANTPEQQWAVQKDGGRFDQFTGATITPRAVVKGVHQGLLLIEQWRQQQPQFQQPSSVAITGNEQEILQ